MVPITEARRITGKSYSSIYQYIERGYVEGVLSKKSGSISVVNIDALKRYIEKRYIEKKKMQKSKITTTIYLNDAEERALREYTKNNQCTLGSVVAFLMKGFIDELNSEK